MLPLTDDLGSIRAMGAKRVRDPFEFAAADRLAIETQHARDPAHARLPVKSSHAAERGELREAACVVASDDFPFADLDPGMSGDVVAAARDAKAEPARDSAPPEHRMRG